MATAGNAVDERQTLAKEVADAPNPFAVLIRELTDLESSLSLPPHSGQQGDGVQNVSTMRQTWEATVGAVGHEASRFGLVLSQPQPWEMSAVRSTCWSLLESAQLVVSSSQLLTNSVESGGVLDAATTRLCRGCRQQQQQAGSSPAALRPAATFARSLSSYSHSLLRTVKGLVDSAQALVLCAQAKAGSAVALRAPAAHQAFLSTAGMVLQVVQQVRTLPATPAAAVRRQVLVLAKSLRTSAAEIREEHPGSEGASAAAAASAGAGAGVAADLGTAALPAVDCGVLLLKSLASLAKVAAEAADAALAVPVPVEGHVDNVAAAVAGLSIAPQQGSAATSPVPSPPCLDALASSASALQDAIIDLAAAVNDLGDESSGQGLDDDEDEDDEEDEDEEGEEQDGKGKAGDGAAAGTSPLSAVAQEHLQAVTDSLAATRAGVATMSGEVRALAGLLPAARGEGQGEGEGQAGEAAWSKDTLLATLDTVVQDVEGKMQALQTAATAYRQAAASLPV